MLNIRPFLVVCDYFGFKLSDDGTVENVFCMIFHKSFTHYSQLLRQHNYEICEKLTKIND